MNPIAPISPTAPIAITLEAQQWNVVIGALGEIPWRIADPVLREITTQAQAAATEAAPPPAKPNGAAHAIEGIVG